jgi:hypothetical protein
LAAAGRAESTEKGTWPSNHEVKKLETDITKTKAYAKSFKLTLKTDDFHLQARVDSQRSWPLFSPGSETPASLTLSPHTLDLPISP